MNGEQNSFHWRRSRPEAGYELGVIWKMPANNDRSLAQVFRAISGSVTSRLFQGTRIKENQNV
jgi:hypothetical protein